MMRKLVLSLLCSLVLTACATAQPESAKPPSVEVSGRWTGDWSGYGVLNVDRKDAVEAEFVQTGATGHGRLFLQNALTAEAPAIIRQSGANGVPVVFLVSGPGVSVSHELGDDLLTGVFTVSGEQMVGFVGRPPAQVRVTLARTPRKKTAVAEKTAEQTKETSRVNEIVSSLAEVRALSENANSKAEVAVSMIKEISSAAGRADEKAGKALAKAEGTEERLNRLWAARLKRTLVSTVPVTFAFNRSDLNSAAQNALAEVVKQLKENPNLVVDLRGYTDGIGSDAYNLQLSQRREETIRRLLVDNGVDLHRIEFIGFGKAHPAASNATNEGRAQNRRVVIGLFTLDE
jgi:outer membrane protein OmpA-like peptidoglycan-associated protein